MIISNPVQLDDEMIQCTVEYSDGRVVVHTFSTIDDLRAFVGMQVSKGNNSDGHSTANGGLFSGYVYRDSRNQSRY